MFSYRENYLEYHRIGKCRDLLKLGDLSIPNA